MYSSSFLIDMLQFSIACIFPSKASISIYPSLWRLLFFLFWGEWWLLFSFRILQLYIISAAFYNLSFLLVYSQGAATLTCHVANVEMRGFM